MRASTVDRAERAYLATFDGPWGLKASTEDALLSILVELYPHEYGASDAERIYKLREDPRLTSTLDLIFGLEQGGHEARDIVGPTIDALRTVLGEPS